MKEFLHETFFLLTFVEVSFIGVQELQRNGRSSTTSVFGSDNFHFILFPFNNLMFFEEKKTFIVITENIGINTISKLLYQNSTEFAVFGHRQDLSSSVRVVGEE